MSDHETLLSLVLLIWVSDWDLLRWSFWLLRWSRLRLGVYVGSRDKDWQTFVKVMAITVELWRSLLLF